jgi:hypothetical protein
VSVLVVSALGYDSLSERCSRDGDVTTQPLAERLPEKKMVLIKKKYSLRRKTYPHLFLSALGPGLPVTTVTMKRRPRESEVKH